MVDPEYIYFVEPHLTVEKLSLSFAYRRRSWYLLYNYLSLWLRTKYSYGQHRQITVNKWTQ